MWRMRIRYFAKIPKIWYRIVLLLVMLWIHYVIYQHLRQWTIKLFKNDKSLSTVPINSYPAKTQRIWRQDDFYYKLAERLPLRRQLYAARHKDCKSYKYKTKKKFLSLIGIIIIFRNELLEMLLRALHSIYDRTPEYLIDELLIVNDNSSMNVSQQNEFDKYVRQHIDNRARIFHLEQHVGLVRARKFALRAAQANIVVFLDAHVEVTDGWLEPLIFPIMENRTMITMPVLDCIDKVTLEYRSKKEQRSVFDWSLRQRELPLLPEQLKSLPQPYKSPIIQSNNFAIDKSMFYLLQGYDEALSDALSANYELSFKIWLSGGSILQVPCSRVVHLERGDWSYLRSYGNISEMGAKRYRDLKRVVEVWLDDYKKMPYQYQPQLQLAAAGNLTLPHAVRSKLKCKSFDWYLKNVAPDLLQPFPLKDKLDFAQGSIRPLSQPNKCLTAVLDTGSIRVKTCLNLITQNWTLSYMGDIRLGLDSCLDLRETKQGAKLGLAVCHNMGGPQRWRYFVHTQQLSTSRNCLQLDQKNGHIKMSTCRSSHITLKWVFANVQKLALKRLNRLYNRCSLSQ